MHLTPREHELAYYVMQGFCNKEIAYQSGLSIGSVKEYLFRLYKKLNITNRTELALYYYKTKNGTQSKI